MLTNEDIRALAKASELNIRDEDIEDLNKGLNALLQAIQDLPVEELDGVEPLSTTQGGQDE
tara:strand:- start:349 stop:531 length:183 start_codon:yes stop_codon:yes gene_type:complete